MLGFSALVAGSFSLGASAANHLAPEAMTALRFAAAAVILGGITLATGQMQASAARAPWRYAVLGGLFGTYFVLMFYGLKTAPAVSTAAVFTLTPVLSAVIGWWLLRQVTTPRMALALAVGGVGALWVIFDADWRAAVAFQVGRGEMIYFAGCILHAIYTPMVRKLNRGEPALVFSFGVLVAGALVVGAAGWPALRDTPWSTLPPIVWICLIYLAVFATAASSVLLQFAALRLPSAKVMAYTYLTPSWVILWEIARGNPAPPVLMLVGVGLTIVALVLLLKQEV